MCDYRRAYQARLPARAALGSSPCPMTCRMRSANWRQRLRYVVVPGSLPSIAAGTRLALVSALRTTIGIELLAAPSGLGHRIWFAWERFATAELYAALATIAVLGFALNWGLQRWVARFHIPPEGPA